jgi:hypothetical protein
VSDRDPVGVSPVLARAADAGPAAWRAASTDWDGAVRASFTSAVTAHGSAYPRCRHA